MKRAYSLFVVIGAVIVVVGALGRYFAPLMSHQSEMQMWLLYRFDEFEWLAGVVSPALFLWAGLHYLGTRRAVDIPNHRSELYPTYFVLLSVGLAAAGFFLIVAVGPRLFKGPVAYYQIDHAAAIVAVVILGIAAYHDGKNQWSGRENRQGRIQMLGE